MRDPSGSSQGVSDSRAAREGNISKRRSRLQPLVVFVAIAAAVGIALYTLRPPEVVPAGAPTT